MSGLKIRKHLARAVSMGSGLMASPRAFGHYFMEPADAKAIAAEFAEPLADALEKGASDTADRLAEALEDTPLKLAESPVECQLQVAKAEVDTVGRVKRLPGIEQRQLDEYTRKGFRPIGCSFSGRKLIAVLWARTVQDGKATRKR